LRAPASTAQARPIRDGLQKIASTCAAPISENELPIEIGQIEAVFRYPVKSMRGEPLDGATLGWPGLDRGPEGEVR
jgi:hypothetical protein